MDKKLKEDSKIELRINQLEGRVGKVEEKVRIWVHEAVKTNEILLKLLEAQTSNPNDNKKGEKDKSLSKPQDQNKEEAIGQAVGPSNPNTESEVLKAPKKKRMSTQTQTHEESKRQRQSAEERRRERKATMILEKQDQEKTFADLKENTKKIVKLVQTGNLKEVIEKSKQPVSTEVTEEERRGRDEATQILIEQIMKEVEDEEN